MFNFKQFSIRQERSAMKVGTDGVLLGAWTRLTGDEERILDVGSGTSVVSLMLAQRTKTAQVVGVEMDRGAVEDSLENVAASAWSERVSIHNVKIQEFECAEKFDLVVSNPPFFRSSLKSPNKQRAEARHADTLALSDLVCAAKRLLKRGGRLAVVLPVEESKQLDLESCGELYLWRRCCVVTKQGAEPKRMLSEYGLVPPCQPVVNEELIINSESGYSAEYIELTRDFYTQF